MSNPATEESIRSTLFIRSLKVWVAGLAALAGLCEEILRHAKLHGIAALVGAALVPYILYISLSVRAFWKVPPIVVPTTILISGILWTLSLQALDWLPRLGAVALLISVPFATALGLRLIFPAMAHPDDSPEDQERSLTVRSLLNKHKRLGTRASLVKPSPEPEL